MIIITVIRASGIMWHGKLNQIWIVFWQTLAAEVGLFLAAVSAFRALYVSRTKEKRKQNPNKVTIKSHSTEVLRRLRTPRAWYTNRRSEGSEKATFGDSPAFFNIPGGTLTGIRTFINKSGRATTYDSQTMQSIGSTKEYGDEWPLSDTPLPPMHV